MKNTFLISCAIPVIGFMSESAFQTQRISLGLDCNVQAEGVNAPSIISLPDGSEMREVYPIKGTIPKNTLIVMGLKLDSSSFIDVHRIFGPGSQSPRTDDPRESDKLCYKINGDKDIFIVFEAGLPENPAPNLTAFTISYGNFLHCNSFCNKSSTLNTPVSTRNGLHLGMTKSELTQLVGKPSKAEREWVVYFFEENQGNPQSKQDILSLSSDDTKYTVQYNYSWVYAHFNSEKMDYLGISTGGELDW
jgi:hypothetical protein